MSCEADPSTPIAHRDGEVVRPRRVHRRRACRTDPPLGRYDVGSQQITGRVHAQLTPSTEWNNAIEVARTSALEPDPFPHHVAEATGQDGWLADESRHTSELHTRLRGRRN